MRIRTITAGVMLDFNRLEEQIEEVGSFLNSARDIYISSGIEVQTVRLSTQRWETYPLERIPLGIQDEISDIESMVEKAGIDFISIGPATTPAAIKMVPSIIEATTITCCSSSLSQNGSIKHENLEITASAVREISRIASSGSKNFMFAALASVGPDTPFFPASYHSDDDPSFSIGLESGSVVFQAAERSANLKEFTKFLGHLYNEKLTEVRRIAVELSGDTTLKGIDLSYAPGLEENASIALAVDDLIGAPFGSQGTLSACAAITSSLEAIDVERIGYSGLMLPVLEDKGLGAGADIGAFDIQKLLLYSSVCGTGLDAVPIPGDTPISKISATLRDTAYMSAKLGKPLSARLMPIPDKSAGDRTDLGSPYLNDCSILSLI
jgi:uncharacterized protein (UPF0210 family)